MLVTVIVMTSLVFGLDFVFSKLIFDVLTNLTLSRTSVTYDPNPDGARDDDATGSETMTETLTDADTQTGTENDVTETTETIENDTTATPAVDDAPDGAVETIEADEVMAEVPLETT